MEFLSQVADTIHRSRHGGGAERKGTTMARRTYTSRTTGRPITVDDDDAYDAYKDGEIGHPVWGGDEGPRDDRWIERAYEDDRAWR